MAGELVSMSDQFQGLPMESLIGAPLQAAANAQVMLARSTADFINAVGFDPPSEDGTPGELRNVTFEYEAPRQELVPGTGGNPATIKQSVDQVHIKVPLLAIVPTPNLQIDTVDVTFDMEVKSSFQQKSSEDKEFGFEAEAKADFGLFSVSVKVQGKSSSHKESTRSSDNSAKYHVAVHATNHGMPEGLRRVFDHMASSVGPGKTLRYEIDADGNPDKTGNVAVNPAPDEVPTEPLPTA